MPQIDRHWGRGSIPIEFETMETFQCLPLAERMTLVLISNGEAVLQLNGKETCVAAPCMLLVSQYDSLKLVEKRGRFAAKSFSFMPTFINSSLTFEGLALNDFYHPEDEHDRNIVELFLIRNEFYNGILDLPPQTYFRVSEWLSIMGTETFAQSNGSWTCRIRRYLLQTLYLLEDIYRGKRDKSPMDILLEYIHAYYPSEISLHTLCQLIHTNRTSLSKRFKEKTGCTPMDYVLTYRLKIACETLIHTNLSLGEIAEATGFKYDTYFIRQFTTRIGVPPTEYRQKFYVAKKV